MLKKLGVLLLILVTGFGLLLLQTDANTGETINEVTFANPNALGDSGSVKNIDFTFEIIRPIKFTRVDKYTFFQYRLTNLPSSTERIEPEDVTGSSITFDPGLPMDYVDRTDWLIDFSKISLAPGESMTGWFFYFNWSSEVPVGWIQGGYAGIEIRDEFQSVPYRIRIIK